VENLSEQINEIIKKHHNNIHDDLDKLLNESESTNKNHADIIKELTSVRYWSNDSMKIRGNEKETSITLALEFLAYDDAEIDKALETGIFNDNFCE
jgi:hypothetical protein